MKFSIRTKLILAICGPLLPLYVAVSGIDYYAGKDRAIVQMRRHLEELTARLAGEIDKELAVVRQTTRNAAALMTEFPLREEPQLDALLHANVRDTRAAFGSAIAFEPFSFRTDQQRYVRYVCRSAKGQGLALRDIPYDYRQWDWYRLPQQLGQPAWTEPYFDKGAGDILMCTCSAPFYRDRKFQGVVTVDLSLEDLRDALRRAPTGDGYCLIVSRTGTFVSHPDPSRIMADSIFKLAQRHQSAEWAGVAREMVAGKTGVYRLLDVRTGQPAWIVFAPIRSVGWSVAAVIPDAQVMADVYAQQNRQAALFLGGLAAILLLVILVTAWITRPIARLAEAAGELGKGNLEVQVPGVRGSDEIAEFADTFNKMVRQLKGTVEQRIRETAARESLERELQLARRIQTSLLPMVRPPFPGRSEFSLDAHNEPARIMAGDFFDFWLIDEDRLALVVADVSGKGVPAAMFMAVARTILRSFPVPAQSPAQALAIANRIMAADNQEQMFVTVFYAHYHTRTGEFTFANAGHNPPYIVRKDGSVASLGPPTGTIVGVLPDAQFENGRERLSPGDMLVVYTDGVTEAADASGAMFGEERLEGLLSTLSGATVEDVRRRILEEVNAFRQGKDQDDVTLLALKRNA